MESFWLKIQQAIGQIGTIRLADVVDILLVAVIIYFVIDLIRRAHSSRVFVGVLMLLITLWLSGVMHLYTVNYLLRNMVQIGLIALVVLFQPEIRRFLERLGAGSPVTRLFNGNPVQAAESAITQVVMACADLSASKTGALIIFEQDNRLDDQIRTGTILNADITAELLKNIFYPKAPLHDGAVIIRGNRIQAAGCMLPLSSQPNLSRDLGMRHRAGLGISEVTDALVVIVSEETGGISIAQNGMLKRHLAKETFDRILRSELISDESDTGGFKLFRRKDKDEKDEK